ncbi:hypothetical protein U1Q18_018674 [Sarracenia purpurea var. burkii]
MEPQMSKCYDVNGVTEFAYVKADAVAKSWSGMLILMELQTFCTAWLFVAPATHGIECKSCFSLLSPSHGFSCKCSCWSWFFRANGLLQMLILDQPLLLWYNVWLLLRLD